MPSHSFKIFLSFCLSSFIIQLSSATLWASQNSFEPVVQTRYGQIRGIRVPTRAGQLDTHFTQYIGVPYAQPPIGVNRFSDPVPIDNWPGVYDATNGRVMCPQVEQRFKFNNTPTIIESEDCLYLNIYAFNWDSSSVASPVLVYFHGGEFKYGGKDFYSLDTLPQRLGVSGLVLVTVNYRLGPLGFMSTETNNFRGNYGLKDMIMALRWVKSTINAFHGDPERIYIGGHDAGGIAASMMMLITPNERLFAGAFASAGTVFTPWAFERSPNFIARRLSNSIGCYSRDSVRCLQRKSYSEIMSAARNLDLHFRPIVDSNLTMPLFQDEPEILYRNGLFAKVPFIAGVSEKEGALDYYAKYDRISQIPDIREKIKYLLSPYVRRYANLDVLSTLAEFQYFKEEEIAHQRENPRPRLDNAQIDSRLIRLLGDYLYALPAEKALSYHSRGGAKAQFYVYMYENAAGRVQPTFGVLQYNAPLRIARDRFATTHMDDVFIMFRTLYNTPSPQLDNQLLGDILNELRDSSGQSYRWTRYYANSRNFMQIRYGDARQSLNFRTDKEISFWNDLFDSMEELSAAPNPYFPEEEYAAYQAATWSLLGVTLLLLIICIVLALVIFIKRRNDKRSLKLIRKRDNDDLPERAGVLE